MDGTSLKHQKEIKAKTQTQGNSIRNLREHNTTRMRNEARGKEEKKGEGKKLFPQQLRFRF